MGAKVIIFGQSLNSNFLKGLTYSAMFSKVLIEVIRTTGLMISHRLADKVCRNKNGKDGQTRQCRYSYL